MVYEIIEGFRSGCCTNILPARFDADGKCFKKEKEQFSVVESAIDGYISILLDRYYTSKLQPDRGMRVIDGFDSYGETYYSREQIESVLTDLERFVRIAGGDPLDPEYAEFFGNLPQDKTADVIRGDARTSVDFYSRFAARMRKMLRNMDGFDMIVFIGP